MDITDIDAQMLHLSASELADMILQENAFMHGSQSGVKDGTSVDADKREVEALQKEFNRGAKFALGAGIAAKLAFAGGKAIYNKLKKKDAPQMQQMPYGSQMAPQQHYVPYQQLQFHGVGQNQHMPMDGMQHTQMHQMQLPRMQQMQMPMHYNRY